MPKFGAPGENRTPVNPTYKVGALPSKLRGRKITCSGARDLFLFWIRQRDSNPCRRVQSPLSCH